MSLDVYLMRKRDEPTEAEKAINLLREHGFERFAFELECTHETGDEELYSANITHNLTGMASEAGIYQHLWRPEELGITKAKELIQPLRDGVALMQSDPPRFEKHNSPNGWGLYKNFVPFVQKYLLACEEYPDAEVRVSR